MTPAIFPKPFMKLSELKELGLPEEMLMRAYRDKTQTFAAKISKDKPGGDQ